MKAILLPLIVECIIFMIVTMLVFFLVSEITEHLPRSLDPTGMGMLAVIVLFIGFVIGSFKIGASYSDDLDVQTPGSLVGVFRRQVRSVKYGAISLIFNFILLYVMILLSSYIMY